MRLADVLKLDTFDGVHQVIVPCFHFSGVGPLGFEDHIKNIANQDRQPHQPSDKMNCGGKGQIGRLIEEREEGQNKDDRPNNDNRPDIDVVFLGLIAFLAYREI